MADQAIQDRARCVPASAPMFSLLTRRFGTPLWDRFLRLSLVVLLVAIPVTLAFPEAGGLVAFGLVTVWVNGPIAPFLPSTYEPIIILFGRVYSPLLVAAVGTVGTLYAEYVNYHLYRRMFSMRALDGARQSRLSAWVLKRFRKAPFLTIWLCSWSILPYWPVRFISPLAGYDVRRQLVATGLGRFPRIFAFAWFGSVLQIDVAKLALISLGLIALAIIVFTILRVVRRTPDEHANLAAGLEPSEG